jgi:hypothetical protein
MPAPGCLILKPIPFNFRLEAGCLTVRRELRSFFECLLSAPEVNRVERSLTACGRDEYELVVYARLS